VGGTVKDSNEARQAGMHSDFEGEEWEPRDPPGRDGEGKRPDDWEPPIPLGAVTGELPPFPVDALPRWLRDHVEAVSEFSQTPFDLAGMIALASLSACARGRFDIECPPGHCEPLTLYVAVALPPGERKTSVHAALTRPIVDWEHDCAEAEAETVAERQAERTMLTKRIEHLQGRGAKADDPDDRRSIMHDVASTCAELEAAPAIVPTVILVDDCTPEALVSTLAEQNGRLAVLSAEGGVFDIVAGLYSDARSNLDGLLKAHDAEPIRVRRQTRAPLHVPRPVLTIGLAVQPSVIEAIGQNGRFRGRGLLARFLYAIPSSRLGSRSVNPAPAPAAVTAEFARRVRDLLDAVPEGVEVLHLDSEALSAWRAFAAEIEPRLHPDTGDLAPIADWAGKLPGAVARIAGLLALADPHNAQKSPQSSRGGNCGDCGDYGLKKPKISLLPSILSAIRIGRYLIGHAQATFSVMGADPAVAGARYALRWVAEHGADGFTARDLWQGVRGRACFGDMEAVRHALGRLEEHGYIRPRPIPRGGPGRPASPCYDVSPFLRHPHPHNPHNPRNPHNPEGARA